MLRFFGTDGIRGIAGKNFDETLIKKIANASIGYLKHKNLPLKIMIAKDTRLSCDWIFSILCNVFLKNGVELYDIGVAPTACVAYLMPKYGFSLGITISASHNTYDYNGIKFFDQYGYKMSDMEEEFFESFILQDLEYNKCINGSVAQEVDFNFTKITNGRYLVDYYIDYLKNIIEKEYTLPVIFDCANGAGAAIVEKLFANKHIVANAKDGRSINEKCGCTNIDFLVLNCKLKKCVGFAFDGDADRMICVDELGNVIDGDKVLFILAKEFLEMGDTVVGTIATNYGMEQSLVDLGFLLHRTSVGDKYIANCIRNGISIVGGETSGHTIVSKYSTTGDGILTAIYMLNILAKYDCTFNQLLQNYKEYSQFSINFPCTNQQKTEIMKNEDFLYFIELCEQELVANGRILVRPSGTEAKLRIMVEGMDYDLVKTLAQKIEKYYNTHFLQTY